MRACLRSSGAGGLRSCGRTLAEKRHAASALSASDPNPMSVGPTRIGNFPAARCYRVRRNSLRVRFAMERADAWHMTDRLQAEHGKGDPFAAAIRGTRMPMLITDPRQDDNPIVFVNDAFLLLTGYERDEVLGRNCRFLQGPNTDPAAVTRLRDAIGAETDI